jgi:hypothetical protein
VARINSIMDHVEEVTPSLTRVALLTYASSTLRQPCASPAHATAWCTHAQAAAGLTRVGLSHVPSAPLTDTLRLGPAGEGEGDGSQEEQEQGHQESSFSVPLQLE